MPSAMSVFPLAKRHTRNSVSMPPNGLPAVTKEGGEERVSRHLIQAVPLVVTSEPVQVESYIARERGMVGGSCHHVAVNKQALLSPVQVIATGNVCPGAQLQRVGTDNVVEQEAKNETALPQHHVQRLVLGNVLSHVATVAEVAW